MIALVTSTVAAQQTTDSIVSPAVRAARAVPTSDYFIIGALSGVLVGDRLGAVAFTDDKSITSIGFSVVSIATFITKWRSASRVVVPPAAVGEVRAPSAAEWSAIYSSTLTERRRSGLFVGLVTGSAIGAIVLFLRSLPET